MNLENNKVSVTGTIIKEFEFSHIMFGEKFYTSEILCKRKSGNTDILPIIVSERIFDVKMNYERKSVAISGSFRSRNYFDGESTHLELYIFAESMDISEDTAEDKNDIEIVGYVSKPTFYRVTPRGIMITDVFLAVNRNYGKSDYIPCLFWGRNAIFAKKFSVGTKLKISGRIQRRLYYKKISEEQCEIKTIYEVAVREIKEVFIYDKN